MNNRKKSLMISLGAVALGLSLCRLSSACQMVNNGGSDWCEGETYDAPDCCDNLQNDNEANNNAQEQDHSTSCYLTNSATHQVYIAYGTDCLPVIAKVDACTANQHAEGDHCVNNAPPAPSHDICDGSLSAACIAINNINNGVIPGGNGNNTNTGSSGGGSVLMAGYSPAAVQMIIDMAKSLAAQNPSWAPSAIGRAVDKALMAGDLFGTKAANLADNALLNSSDGVGELHDIIEAAQIGKGFTLPTITIDVCLSTGRYAISGMPCTNKGSMM